MLSERIITFTFRFRHEEQAVATRGLRTFLRGTNPEWARVKGDAMLIPK